MAWMAAHIFVGSKDHVRLVEAVTALLRTGEHRADQEGILDPPGPVMVTEPVGDWMTVSGLRLWVDDLPWAAGELARATGAAALSCELVGNSYCLRIVEHQEGRRAELACTPEGSFTGGLEEAAEMPLYEDAERLAFELLGDRAVPAALVTLGAAPLGHERPTLLLGEAALLQPLTDGVERRPLAIRGLDYQSADPPVVPTGSSRDFGLMLFEDRYVEGRPSETTLERLLAIEEEILARAKRAAPESQVTLTVTYHGGLHQRLLDEMLRQRGRPTAAHLERGEKRPPWWQFWRYLGKMR